MSYGDYRRQAAKNREADIRMAALWQKSSAAAWALADVFRSQGYMEKWSEWQAMSARNSRFARERMGIAT